MVLDEVEVTERVNKDTWKVKAIYKDENSDEEEETTSFAFDTGGGTICVILYSAVELAGYRFNVKLVSIIS